MEMVSVPNDMRETANGGIAMNIVQGIFNFADSINVRRFYSDDTKFDDKSSDKRKAIQSPFFEQFESIPEVSGSARRPSKKSQQGLVKSSPNGCQCTGKCRNARCSCIRKGAMCSLKCGCKQCRNPLYTVADQGISVDHLMQNPCFVQNLSKIKDMEDLLKSDRKLECCGKVLKVAAILKVLEEDDFIACQNCKSRFSFSWCKTNIYDIVRKPTRHCPICKKCRNARFSHCIKCNRCYFSGIDMSFSCICEREQVHDSDHENQNPRQDINVVSPDKEFRNSMPNNALPFWNK